MDPALLDVGLLAKLADGVKTLGVLTTDAVPKEVRELVAKREASRVARNWLLADTLREAITLKGFSVEDTPHGPKISHFDPS